MTKYLAIFIGTAFALEKSEWNTMDDAKRKKMEATGMKAWGDCARLPGINPVDRAWDETQRLTSADTPLTIRQPLSA
jgi:hypothetical protein